MPISPPLPTLEFIRQTAAVPDPVIRNLQITQCYHDLSAILASRTSKAANWCTYATWASKQAGQSIRKEDLRRLLENRLKKSLSTHPSAESFSTTADEIGAGPVPEPQELVLEMPSFTSAIDRTSAAVSRGNQKVFEEIGYEFARFYLSCLHDSAPNSDNFARFAEGLRPGDPPDGQGFLRQAFQRYYHAMFEPDAGLRAQLIFLANIEIGFHEQTRLQPEIAASLDAGLINLVPFTRLLVAALFPTGGMSILANLYLRRLLGRPTPLDLAARRLHLAARTVLHETITEVMMTIALPSGVILRLGRDLGTAFPASLQRITLPECAFFLAQHDPTPDSTIGSGAVDWASLPDRLHFIIDFFRCCQEDPALFSPPFTLEQVEAFQSGRLPAGKL